MLALPEGIVRAEGATGLIIFAVVYAIVAILGKMKEASQKGKVDRPPEGAPTPRPARPRTKPVQPRGPRQQPRPQPQLQSRPDKTQSEATRLEDLLRALGEAAGVPTTGGPMGRPSRSPLPADEDAEERESLEVEEQIQNLEEGYQRTARREVDFDDEAEAIVQRRIRAAQERDRGLNRADHQAFDQRIRKVAADHTSVAKPKRPSMKEAMIWREILGPPLGLRDRDTTEGG